MDLQIKKPGIIRQLIALTGIVLILGFIVFLIFYPTVTPPPPLEIVNEFNQELTDEFWRLTNEEAGNNGSVPTP